MSKKRKTNFVGTCPRWETEGHRPHPVKGDRVAVIREEHGWHDGRLEGVVTSAECRPAGGCSYTVLTDEGYEVYCRGRGDVRTI